MVRFRSLWKWKAVILSYLHDFVLGALFQEDEAIVEGRWEARNVCPDVKGGNGLKRHLDSHLRQLCQEKITLLLKEALKCPGIAPNKVQIHQRQGEALDGGVGTTIKVGSGK